jgi:streptogramin lyase
VSAVNPASGDQESHVALGQGTSPGVVVIGVEQAYE